MKYDAFIGQVQHHIRGSSRGEAEEATRAFLETLGQRLPAELVDKMAEQLPHPMARWLRTLEPYTKLRLDEFLDRVSLREGIARPLADDHARAVVRMLEAALAGGAMDKIRESLPQEFEPLVAGAGRHPEHGTGLPGGGAGRVEVARGSGVYPMSGPLPPGDAPTVAPAAWGQGDRGAAGYEDHGESELHGEGLLGGEDELEMLHEEADIPLS